MLYPSSWKSSGVEVKFCLLGISLNPVFIPKPLRLQVAPSISCPGDLFQGSNLHSLNKEQKALHCFAN